MLEVIKTKGVPMTQTAEPLIYSVPDVSCGHCRAAITGEVEEVAGVTSVEVDLAAKRVTVAGAQLDDAAVRAAIGEAGFDIA
jgi:copper chaperone